MGFVQPPSCIRCILAKKNKNLPNEYDNRQCKNLVVWRRNVNTGEEYRFHPDKLDGNILIVTCAAAQSWCIGEIADGKKWDAEKKVVYEVKGKRAAVLYRRILNPREAWKLEHGCYLITDHHMLRGISSFGLASKKLFA